MENDADNDVKLKIYELIISRYKDKIEEGEHKSISELRERISPYNEFIKQLAERLSAELKPYEYEKHFPPALQNSIEYIKGIRNVELPVSFWIDFQTMDELKAGDVIDQALLLTSLLRAFGSPGAKMFITKSRKVYVGYEWKGEQHIINPESGSVLSGEDVQKTFAEDPIVYAFSDLYFESYGEE
ncbi:Uncharacterised protein [uncultured archaeon]|nr:Uncharacterised protein [uncultured archaeon]